MDTHSAPQNIVPELARLVESQVINKSQAREVQTALGLSQGSVINRSRRSLLSEAITYIGGAVIVVSAILLLSTTWESLGQWGRPGVLAAAGLILGVAATFLGHDRHDDPRRRLCSTLYVASSVVSAFALGLFLSEFWVPKNDPMASIYVDPAMWVMPVIFMISTTLAGVIGVIGYRRANSALGVIGLAAALGGFVEALGMWIWWEIKGEETYPFLGFVFLFVVASGWLVAAKRNVFKEDLVAKSLGLLGLVIAVEGLRSPLPEDFASISLLGLGLTMLWTYMQNREWVFLVGGIAPMLMGGIEVLTRYVSGPLGSLASMAFGIVILVVGLRLFKEKQD